MPIMPITKKKTRKAVAILGVLFAGTFFLQGCAFTKKSSAPVIPQVKTGSQKNAAEAYSGLSRDDGKAGKTDGSLWSNGSMMNHLFITPKPRNIGDIVTIKVVESASASNNAKTNTGRKSSLTASIDKLLGLEDKYTNSSNPDFKEFPNFNPFGSIEGSMTSKFDGTGATKRSGDLTAYVTARIAHVYPNGDFFINGSREITVNYEKQLIKLTGIIRPDDIDSNNVILSTYISDAKIVYSGSGVIQKRQKPGWLANVINTIWPF